MTNLAGSAPAEPRLWRAGHAGSAYDADIADFRAALGALSGLGYLAHMTYGIVDFTLGVPERWPDGNGMAEAVESAVRKLNLAVIQLDKACASLDSGALIRVVLQGENGALFQTLKVAGQSIAGLTFDSASEVVATADARLAALAESSASRIGGIPLDWGGFKDRERSGRLPAQQPGPMPAGGMTPAVAATYGAVIPDRVARACLEALHPDDLHYVALYRRAEQLWSADIFETRELAPFFQRVTPASRRHGYMQVLQQIELLSHRLLRLLELVHSKRLERLVLDVARGAVFVLPVAGDDLLVAATLIQARVEGADEKARNLRSAIVPWWPAGTSATVLLPP